MRQPVKGLRWGGWCVPSAFAIAVSAMLGVTGCGEQDLYKPPHAPWQIVGRVNLPSINEDVSILGDHAYVAGGEAGLHVIDIRNPAMPIVVKTIRTKKYAEAVRTASTPTVAGIRDIAFVSEGTEGITTYDITKPDSTFSCQQGTTAVDGNGIFIELPPNPSDPCIVYLAETWKGLRIFEADPNVVGRLAYNGVFAATRGYAKGVSVAGGFAYVADDELGLTVLDVRVRQLGIVKVVSGTDTPGKALGVDVKGDYAYIADGLDGLVVMRVNGGDTPLTVGHLALPGTCRSIVVRGTTAFIAAQDGGLHVVSVADPAGPTLLGSVATTYATGVSVGENGIIGVSDRVEGLLLLGGPGAFPDVTPPAPVRDLATSSVDSTTVRLRWTAPGNDYLFGTAVQYDVRRSTAPIDPSNWDAATACSGEPSPEPRGTVQTLDVGGLTPGLTYYFAMKTADAVPNWSGLSNVATGVPRRDTVPPARIVDLVATSLSVSSVELRWTAPGNDLNVGIAAQYDIRYATTAIDDGTWGAATQCTGMPAPAMAGTVQTFDVTGLAAETTYYFAMKTADAVPNWSPLSNLATASTASGNSAPILSAGSVAPPSGAPDLTTFVFEVTYRDGDGDAPTTATVTVAGVANAMDQVSGDYTTGALYRYQTTLGSGRHTYSFTFDDGQGHVVSTAPAAGPDVGEIFTIGSPVNEYRRDADEAIRSVLMTQRIHVEDHEVTQAEYRTLMGTNPSRFLGDSRPVENVTWFDAIQYCNARSLADGLAPAYPTIEGEDVTWDRNANGWRLPTEAEWEIACRAGTSTPFYAGAPSDTLLACAIDENGTVDPVVDGIAWFCGNAIDAGAATHDVKQKAPNVSGLYDMSGNVWEWCWDWYGPPADQQETDPSGPSSGTQRVRRGGSWYGYSRFCRSASRDAYYPNSKDDVLGFRVVKNTE